MSEATIAERAKALDHAHVMHPWSTQAETHGLLLAGGLGCEVWDFEGTRWLDFSSQLVNLNLGHQHPGLVAAIREQAAVLATISPAYANAARSDAAARLLSHAPNGFTRVFFTNGGADAIENAIRMARLATGRSKVLSAYRSYHGNTGSAIAATGDWRRQANEYSRGHVHAFGPYLYRSEFWATTEQEECERALHHLSRVIEAEGPEDLAAVLFETIPGAAGVLIPPAGYLAGVREICDRHGIVLILDEVMTGFGRTGHWLGLDAEAVRPDLVTFAKGVNSGYVPVGGVLVSEKIARHFDHEIFRGGLTYSGHPLAAATIVATIDIMEADDVVEHAAITGRDVLGPALAELREAHGIIGEVRGRGMFWALELVEDRVSRIPLGPAPMSRLEEELLARGLIVLVRDNRLIIAPPLVTSRVDIRRGIEILDHALRSPKQREDLPR
jgi:taurine--2-oxoglutarate transaminase